MSLPKLYQYEVCPFCWKVRCLLALKGVAYETIEVHPLNKKELEFSEYKKVPIFVDENGKQINDSNEIMRYIDSHYEGAKFFEVDSAAIDKEKQLFQWSELYVKSIPPLIYDSFPHALQAFDYITQNTKFSWYQKKLIKYSGAAVMKMVAAKSKQKQNIEDPVQHFKNNMQNWSTTLGGQQFAGGDKPNAVDAAVYGVTLSVSGLPASSLIPSHAKFYEWALRMGEKTRMPLKISKV